MTRTARAKFDDPQEGYYHITSRTIQKYFILHQEEKVYLQALLKKLSQVYFVKIPTYSIMTNHIHIIVRMLRSEDISDADLQRRFEKYYNESKPAVLHRDFDPVDAPNLRRRWSDVSCFIQDLFQRFARWYNRRHDGCGHVWADRFKSVMLKGNRALLACMVYVDLNSFRAKIVEKPEEYPFCGLFHMVHPGRSSTWLDEEAIRDVFKAWGIPHSSPKVIKKGYLTMVTDAHKPPREMDEQTDASKEKGLITMCRRINTLTEGIFLGDRSFCEEKFRRHRTLFKTAKEKHGQPLLNEESSGESVINLLNGLFSIKRTKWKQKASNGSSSP